MPSNAAGIEGSTPIGYAADYSSYGTLADGRTLPHICAPGTGVISSYSSQYLAANSAEVAQCSGMTTFNGKDYYWMVSQGTSMACPYATGVVALWLEADPTLTFNDVRDIMAKTAITTDGMVEPTVKWGKGKLNALAGIKEVIARGSSGVDGITVGNDTDNAIITSADGGKSHTVFMPGASSLTLELYTLAGTLAARSHSAGDTATISAEGAASGVCVLRAVSAEGKTISEKVVIR